MPSVKDPRALSFPAGNRILSAIPEEEYGRILPHLTPVRLPRGKVLWDGGDVIRDAYFVAGGMLSLLSTTGEGSTIEVGMIGSEGLAGIAAVLGFEVAPYGVVVQIPAPALRVKVDALRREFARGGRLQLLLLRYTHALLTQVSQSASCNRFHTVEERLCRWLLISRDRAESDTLPLTQEFLSHMLGVRRSGVTVAGGVLEQAGFLTHSRGQVVVKDAEGLAGVSCECIRALEEEYEGFVGDKIA